MLQLKSFILILFLNLLVSVSIQEVPKNEIQPQQQPSMLAQSLPKEKLIISESDNARESGTEIQHKSKAINLAERLDFIVLINFKFLSPIRLLFED